MLASATILITYQRPLRILKVELCFVTSHPNTRWKTHDLHFIVWHAESWFNSIYLRIVSNQWQKKKYLLRSSFFIKCSCWKTKVDSFSAETYQIANNFPWKFQRWVHEHTKSRQLLFTAPPRNHHYLYLLMKILIVSFGRKCAPYFRQIPVKDHYRHCCRCRRRFIVQQKSNGMQ